MAERDVDELIRVVARIVAKDIRSYGRRPDGQPPVSENTRQAIEPLAVNLDRPRRLVPGPGEVDRRPEIWRGLAEVAAQTVDWLSPDDPLDGPPAAVRFGKAGVAKYAETATLRLIRQEMPVGVVDALGPFPEPSAEGDVAAVGHIVRDLSRRTGEVNPALAISEDRLWIALAGHGRYLGQETATVLIRRRRLVLDQDGELARLSPHDELEIADRVAPELESGLEAVTGAGPAAALLDRAGAMVDRALHERFPEAVLPMSAFRDLAGDLEGRPESVQQLVARIHLAVGELTGAPRSLWSGRIEAMRSNDDRQVDHGADGTLELTAEAEASLRALTVGGLLNPEQVESAQNTIQDISRAFTRMAVPDGHTRADEQEADYLPTPYEVSELAVIGAFLADNGDEILARVLPADLAGQLSMPELSAVDRRHAAAARGLASAVDTVVDASQGDTLRQLAGQSRQGLSRHVAETLVEAANLRPESRPAAIDAIAGRVELGFEQLPAEAGDPTLYGEQLCRNAQEYLSRFESAADPLNHLAVAVGERIGRDADPIRTELAAAGPDGAGLVAARLLMAARPGFASLAGTDQQAIEQMVATRLESRLAEADPGRGEFFPELRSADPGEQAAAAVHEASSTGESWLERWRNYAPVMTVEVPTTYAAPVERPEDVPDLLRRIQGAVAQLTGAPCSLWNEEVELLAPYTIHPVDQGPDGALHLSRSRAELPLELLTKSQGLTDEEQVRAAQVAVQAVSGAFVWGAVPRDYTRGAAELADADLSRDAITTGTMQAFNQRSYNEILVRVFPADLADRLRAVESPYADVRFAPAAQAFAATVDALNQDSEPGETLRLMAGQGPAGIAKAAAEQLASDIPAETRPVAVSAIAEQIERDFDALHGEVAPWTNVPAGEPDGPDHVREQWARLSAGHGEAIAQRAHGLAQEYANGSQAAGEDPAFRLHTDQAQQPLGAVHTATETSTARRAAGPGQGASNSLQP